MKEEEENASSGTDSAAEGEVKTETGLNKRTAIANYFILTLLNFHPDSTSAGKTKGGNGLYSKYFFAFFFLAQVLHYQTKYNLIISQHQVYGTDGN